MPICAKVRISNTSYDEVTWIYLIGTDYQTIKERAELEHAHPNITDKQIASYDADKIDLTSLTEVSEAEIKSLEEVQSALDYFETTKKVVTKNKIVFHICAQRIV